jgi:hypothetical protein
VFDVRRPPRIIVALVPGMWRRAHRVIGRDRESALRQLSGLTFSCHRATSASAVGGSPAGGAGQGAGRP